MIRTREELKQYLAEDAKANSRDDRKKTFMDWVTQDHMDIIWRFIVWLRRDEYYTNNKQKLLNKFCCIYARYRKNRLGHKVGLVIPHNVFGPGLLLYHGNMVINGLARVGKGCKLHGENCIGNNGFDIEKAPVIGDNVDIGVGAKVIGDVYIANNIIIGANAVVTKSFYEEGITIAGVPARKIRDKSEIQDIEEGVNPYGK